MTLLSTLNCINPQNCAMYSIKCNEINVCHSDIQKMFPMKNGLNNIDVLCTGSHKSFPIHYSLCWKNLTLFQHAYIVLNIMKIIYFIDMHKRMFHVQDHAKDF